MQDEIWHQFGIQNYNGNVLSVYSVATVQILYKRDICIYRVQEQKNILNFEADAPKKNGENIEEKRERNGFISLLVLLW